MSAGVFTNMTGQRGVVRAAAVVLAAGFSSRMGMLKPLLPLGSSTTIERVVSSLRAAGVDRLVVVTGHEAEQLAPVLERLGVKQAHNPDYETGMFSSVRTGVAAIGPGCDAFFLLPVDCPLVAPRILRLLLERFARGDATVVYPTCFGRRGHPPLIAARCSEPLLHGPGTGSLQDFLAAYADRSAEVDGRDLTVLMDMDTPDDYTTLRLFADALDRAASRSAEPEGDSAAGEPGGGRADLFAEFPAGLGGAALVQAPRPEPSLSTDDALFLLAAAGTPPNVIRHCIAAGAVGEALAQALQPTVPGLDIALVRAACLLHDMARTLPRHATLAAEVLTNLGLPRLGAVVGEHMVLAPDRPRSPGLTEAELVYLADKTVADGEVVGLDERTARALRKVGPKPEAIIRIEERMEDARAIAEKVDGLLGRPAAELLRNVVLPEGARSSSLQVYLVRHAESEGPKGDRFHGQADSPLGSRGEEQAGLLARRLMALTGGACFDAVISSDLRRSTRTAEIVSAECGTPVRTEGWLREIDVGLWEGLTREEARERHPLAHARRERDLAGTAFPGGESFKDLRGRVLDGFQRLLEQSLAVGHRRVLVVGHKGVNRVILGHLRGIPLEEIFALEQDFCAVTLIQVARDAEGDPRVTAIVDRDEAATSRCC